MNHGTPGTAGNDLDDARRKIAAAREALQAALDAQGDVPEVRQKIDRRERLAAEVARVGRAFARNAVGAP